MMTSYTIQGRMPHFGAKPEPSGASSVEGFRSLVVETAEKTDTLVFQPGHLKRPPTRTSQGWSKIKRAAGITLGILALAGVTRVGLSSKQAYDQAKPSPVAVAIDESLQPDWQMLKGSFNAMKTMTNAQNEIQEELKADFYSQLEAMTIRMMETFKQHPNDSMDAVLVEKIEKNSDFLPWKQAAPVSKAFVDFMSAELAAQNATPMNAKLSQIQNVDLKSGFIDEQPAFVHLSNAEKQQLAQDLKGRYIERWQACQKLQEQFRDATFFVEAYFRDLVVGKLGTGFDGLNLGALEQISSKEDAKALMTDVISNSKNYQSLTPGEREAFLTRSLDVLDTLDTRHPSVLWGAAAWLMLLGGGAGVVALGVTRGNRLLEGASGTLDLYRGVTHPTLFVEKDPLINPQAQTYLNLLSSEMSAKAEKLATLWKNTYETNPDFQRLLVKRYPTAQDLPDAKEILRQYIFNAQQTLTTSIPWADRFMETATHELAFAQQVHQQLQRAYDEGAMDMLGIPKGMVAPPARPEIERISDPRERLRAEKQRIEFDLEESRTFLVQRIAAQAQAAMELKEEETALIAVFDQVQPQETNAFKPEQKIRYCQNATQEPLADAYKEYAQAQKRLEERTQMVTMSKQVISQTLTDARSYLRQITDALANNRFRQDSETFRSVQKDLSNTLEDPSLKRLLYEAEIEEMMAEQEAEQAAKEDAMKCKVDALLQAIQERENVTNHNHGNS
jgi:hypothetical protein